jgi:hypothetical protein
MSFQPVLLLQYRGTGPVVQTNSISAPVWHQSARLPPPDLEGILAALASPLLAMLEKDRHHHGDQGQDDGLSNQL